jgi:hypothetical protein
MGKEIADMADYQHCASASLAPDVRRLDDGPPLLDVGLLQCAEHSRRLLVARGHLISQVGELLNDARVGQRAHHCSIKLINDIFRCAPGRENPIPARHGESGETRLIRCWNVGRCRQAVAPRDGKPLDRARPY